MKIFILISTLCFISQITFALGGGSSESERTKKNIYIAPILTGYGPSQAVLYMAGGGIFGIQLTTNTSVELEYVQGEPLSLSFFSKYTIKTQSYGLHIKHFIGNSFYLRLGADQRAVDYSYQNYNIMTGQYDDLGQFKGSSVAATFVIGNQWQFEYLTIGCDWVGVAVPLSSQISSESISATASASSVDSFNSDKDKFTKSTTAVLVRFYLGMSF